MGKSWWEEAKQSWPAEQLVPVGVTMSPLLGSSNNRVGVIISANATNPIFVSWRNDTGAATGLMIPAGSLPLMISAHEYGRLVRGPIYACIPAGAGNVWVMELIHPCNCME